MALQLVEDEPRVRLVLGRPRRPRIAFDRELGVIVGGRWPGWLVRPTRIAVADLDRVRIAVARDHSIELSIRYRRRHDLAELQHAFAVRDLDLDHEVLDLAFRIAQICRLGGYLVRESSKDTRTLDLVPQGPDDASPYRMSIPALRSIEELAGGAVREVPPVVERADYRGERPRFREPESPAPAPKVGDTIAGIRVVAWESPHIELEIAATITGMGAWWNAVRHGLATLASVAVAGMLAIGFEGCRRLLFYTDAGFYSWKDYAAFIVVVLLWISGGLAAVGAFVGAYNFARTAFREVRRDLRRRGARRISIARDNVTLAAGTPREVATRDVAGVVLRVHPDGDREWCELELVLPGDDLLLATSPAIDKRSRANAERLAIGLARELDVPYQIVERKA